jgi:signal transduction histidine kinase
LISHEFRTPLTAIHGGARLLARQGSDLDEQTRGELLADIATESERLDAMLRNMLGLAAVMAGRLAPATEPITVGPLARRVVAEVAPRSPAHAFVVDVPPGLPPAEGDPALLAQVLRNLYENAVKYAPGGGEVRTTVEHDEATVTIRVSDRGVGIAPENVPHVFERFRRPGADPTVRGMGLGLYLSRHLVEAQGGRIAAASAGPGQGAIFSVALPRADARGPRGRAAADRHAEASACASA